MNGRIITLPAAFLLVLVILYLLCSDSRIVQNSKSIGENPSTEQEAAVQVSVPEYFESSPYTVTESEALYSGHLISAMSSRSGVQDTACELSGYTAIKVIVPDSGIVSIPENVNGIPVKYISSHLTVSGNARRVLLQNSAIAIFSDNIHPADRKGAFYGNKYITSFIPSENLVYIGDKAFYGCESLNSIFLPMGLKHIGSRAFYGCKALDNVYVFGNTSIGEGAFAGCSNLKEVYLSEKVRRVGMGAFEHTPFYENLSDEFCVVGDVLIKYNGNSTDIVIPDGVRIIADGAFAGRLSVKSVVIPPSVEYIGNSAFRSCAELVSVSFDDKNPPVIGENTFEGCPVSGSGRITALTVDNRDMFISESNADDPEAWN